MAYLQQDKEDENKAQGLNQVLAPQADQAPTAPTEASSVTVAQASSAPTSGAMPAQNAQQPNAKAGSGTFTNLKNYLSANQGNRVASAATQKVSNLATGAQKGITQASTGFGQKVEQGTLANRGQALQDVQATTTAARAVEETGRRTRTPEELARAQELQGAVDTAQGAYDASVTTGKESSVGAFGREVRNAPKYDETLAPAIKEAQDAASMYEAEQAKLDSEYKPKYLDEAQKKRFADIINAKYAGPESLRQSGLLQPAAEKVNTAARQINNAATAEGREELLRSMYGKNRDYTRGQNKLDSLLLNTSDQGVSQLQEAAKAGGNLQQVLQQAESGSQNLAQNRAQEISGIREQSRAAFTKGRSDEEDVTQKRIDDLIKTPVLDKDNNQIMRQDGKPMTEWDRLPEHFRNSLANKAAGTKKVKEEQLASISTQYAPQLEAVANANKQIADTDAELKKLQREAISLNMGYTFGEGYSNPGPQTLEAIARVQDRISTLQQQSANQKAQAAALQQTPEYKQYQQQKAAADQMNMNQWALSPEEAAVLGVSAGEGLYNIGQGDIRTTAADEEKLITQNEFARQQALSQLAGLDTSNALQKELKYKDQAKAGTQDLTKSLDTESFRNLLNEAQQGFKESAEGADLVGSGKKKVSRGNMFGKKTSTYYASAGGNVADMLKQGGYDLGAEGASGARSLLSDKDMLANYLGATRNNASMEGNIGGSTLEGTTAGAGAGAGIGTMIGGAGLGTGVGAAVGGMVGGMVGSNSYGDQLQVYSDLLKDFDSKLGIKGAGAIGQGIQDVRGVAASGLTGLANMGGSSMVGDAFRGLAGAVGGINTGAMKEFGDAIAKEKAREDLQNKYAAYLKGQGFENRANIADTETTRARTAALNQLLQRKG